MAERLSTRKTWFKKIKITLDSGSPEKKYGKRKMKGI
jgi:hypothetical protein